MSTPGGEPEFTAMTSSERSLESDRAESERDVRRPLRIARQPDDRADRAGDRPGEENDERERALREGAAARRVVRRHEHAGRAHRAEAHEKRDSSDRLR